MIPRIGGLNNPRNQPDHPGVNASPSITVVTFAREIYFRQGVAPRGQVGAEESRLKDGRSSWFIGSTRSSSGFFSYP